MEAAAAAAQPSPIAGFIPIIAIFAIFYFLVIRPQQKQMAEQKKLLEALKKGDRVLTTGGLYGTITALRGPDLQIQIAEGVKILIARAAVQKLANSPELAAKASA